ncbi:hypothetical protein PP613_21985 [Mycobacteroides abscessus]|nr:hypothetical protein [Mycobacteroides abscessus]MDM2412043.1 hypothetical protein [Mycobacteroides abscessus]
MSKSSLGAPASAPTTAELDKQVRTINAFVARMAGIDAEIAAEAARAADAAAEEAHIRAEDAYLAAQEAKQRFRDLVGSGVSNS